MWKTSLCFAPTKPSAALRRIWNIWKGGWIHFSTAGHYPWYRSACWRHASSPSSTKCLSMTHRMTDFLRTTDLFMLNFKYVGVVKLSMNCRTLGRRGTSWHRTSKRTNACRFRTKLIKCLPKRFYMCLALACWSLSGSAVGSACWEDS